MLEERLGRNAAPDQTGAAERLLLLDDGDLLAELCGANRGDVAAGSGANDDDVVRGNGSGVMDTNCASSINDSRPIFSMSDRRKTLLIVDDDEGMRETLTGFLRRDLRVLRAATGEGGLQIMEKEDVDLMLLDVHLPGISGFEVLKIVKENYPYVEVIVVSAVKELEIADRGDAPRRVSLHLEGHRPRERCARSSPTPASVRTSAATSCACAPRSPRQNDREFVVGPSQGDARRSSSWCRRSRSCRRRC